jgi:hypothetical protein
MHPYFEALSVTQFCHASPARSGDVTGWQNTAIHFDGQRIPRGNGKTEAVFTA